jgi:5-methylcytosine-specific restriction endonuclease McrA
MSYYDQNRPEQEAFYKSWKWRKVREAYFNHAKGLCEVCLSKGLIKQGEIVHHKIEMDSEKIQNERLAYGFDNLQLVCRDCHAELHPQTNKSKKRYYIDDDGKVVVNDKDSR